MFCLQMPPPRSSDFTLERMLTTYEPIITQRFDLASKFEWLETNGIGGYASSTLPGLNTRKYHGLLVAATKPPLGRMVLVSKLDESVRYGDQTFELGTNQYASAVFPEGYKHLDQFKKLFFPEFVFQAGAVRLRKTVVALHGENTTLVHYKIEDAPGPVHLTLNPLLAFRDFHIARLDTSAPWSSQWNGTQLEVSGPENQRVFIQAKGLGFDSRPDWYFQFLYAAELERGEAGLENLFSPGKFSVTAYPGQEFCILLSTEDTAGRDGIQLMKAEEQRRKALVQPVAGRGLFYQRLVLAADQFLVKRGSELYSIIAGYPWFSDWGRDTMIALPGICLATGRFAEARRILKAYADETSLGMIPNRFLDNGEEKEYNTVDASLWFFVAVYKYYLATGNRTFVEQEILPVLEEIIHFHLQGTRYQIRVDEDGLLTAGEAGVQLTWMDAKAGDWVVTPRIGKSVEINALWYNALRIYGFFLENFGRYKEADLWDKRALATRDVFEEKFWNPEFLCLFDNLGPDGPDSSIRPNQVFALSLPFPLLSGYKAELVLRTVERHLATPFGLRSLSRSDPRYKSAYGGDRYSRDGAYHQGTVWGWLVGPFIDAVNHNGDQNSVMQVREMMEIMELHMNEAGIGSLSEIFDGDAPFNPKGCFAQAWTVSELLRVMNEYPWTRGHDFGLKDQDEVSQPGAEYYPGLGHRQSRTS
jgi:predicted glycogen debranching enzyme